MKMSVTRIKNKAQNTKLSAKMIMMLERTKHRMKMTVIKTKRIIQNSKLKIKMIMRVQILKLEQLP